jgi:hypothetical protein
VVEETDAVVQQAVAGPTLALKEARERQPMREK